MAGRVVVDDDEQQIADLIEDMRRLRSRLATGQVRGTHDEFTAAATPETTYTLTYIPVDGTCAMFKNGLEQTEDTAYTVDYDTGVVTFVTAPTTGQQIDFRYLITDWLVARSLPEDTGILADTMTRVDSSTTINPASDGGTWTVDGGTWGITSNLGYLDVDSTGTLIDTQALIRRDLGSHAADITVKNRRNSTTLRTGIWLAYDPSTQSGYRLTFGAGTIATVERFESGTATAVGSSLTMTAWNSGGGTTIATLRFVHDGAGNFDVYQNGSLVGSRNDAGTILTGSWVCLSSNRQNTDYWSDFTAEAV